MTNTESKYKGIDLIVKITSLLILVITLTMSYTNLMAKMDDVVKRVDELVPIVAENTKEITRLKVLTPDIREQMNEILKFMRDK